MPQILLNGVKSPTVTRISQVTDTTKFSQVTDTPTSFSLFIDLLTKDEITKPNLFKLHVEWSNSG
jgi:hypothetical protein